MVRYRTFLTYVTFGCILLSSNKLSKFFDLFIDLHSSHLQILKFDQETTSLSHFDTPTSTNAYSNLDDIHELSHEEPYLSRIIRIQEKCKNNAIKRNSILRSSSFKYDDSVKLVMCETPKAASTTWQLLLLRLSGFKGNFTDKLLAKWAHTQIPNKSFNKLLSEKEAWERVKNYSTFLITRHPFKRLVSAYFDKLTNRSTYTAYRLHTGRRIALQQADKHMHGLGKRIGYDKLVSLDMKFIERMEQFRTLDSWQREDVRKYIQVIKTGEVSFPQFIQFLIQHYYSNEVETMDIHWRPQAMLCQLCKFNYSYVIQFENIVQESNRLLNYIQKRTFKQALPKKLTFPTKTRPAVDDIQTREAFKQLSAQEIDILRQIYKSDFSFYGYDPFQF